MKKALIFGITGQDGILLSKYLQKKKYIVYGHYRNKKKIKLLDSKIKLFYKKKITSNFIKNVLKKIKPQEVYYLIGESDSFKSFKYPTKSLEANFIFFTYLIHNVILIDKKIKIFYASTAEIFGSNNKILNETSIKNPKNPYGISKCLTMEYIKFIRNIYGLNINTGILFNHESEYRNKKNIIRKIINYLNKNDFRKKLILGPLNVYRDWGLASEYIEAIYKINQAKVSDDYIIATGKSELLRNLVSYAFKQKNKNYKDFVKENIKMFKNREINSLRAKPNKIKRKIKWTSKKNIRFFIKSQLK